MKDNRKSPFVSDLTKEVHTSQGIKRFPTLTHITFNNFYGDDTSSGSLIKGSTLSDMYEIVEGQSSAAGAMSSTTATLTDFEVYGETVYANQELYDGIFSTLSMKQRGLRLPLEGSATAATGKKLIVKKDVDDLDPAQAGQTGRCFMLKIKVGQLQNNQALLSIGNPPTGAVSFNIAFTSSGNLQFSHFGSGGSSAQQTWSMNPTDRDRWVTIFVQPYLSANKVQLLGTRIYDTATGELISTTATASGTGTSLDIGTQKNLYIGYGENTGGVNVAFDLADFLCDVDIAEVTVFDRMISKADADLIARSHLKENTFKSGLNNRAPRKTQQLLDARSSYPISANPALPKEPATAFNDTTTKIFGSQPSAPKPLIMYPEALPALMFSGSSVSRGAVGDSNLFYRDIHNTPYENRIVAPGALAQGVSHKETELLNLSSRNSPVSISQDTQVLGGVIAPFNDTNPLADKGNQIAVGESVYPGLQQRLSDHVAIIIDLDPYADSTIGVERDADGRPTGRVTSIAYFNFETKKWETQGKNNDFIIQGPKSIHSTGSRAWDDIEGKENDTMHHGPTILDDTSLAFAGTSGFSIFVDEKDGMSLASLSQRGMPTSNYGFPVHQKYEAKDSQLIDMSEYIDAPFLLERVGFEFGAAIEDSGPHSLGYKVRSNIAGASAAKLMPKVAATLVSGGGAAYNSNVHTTRSPFINGSVVKSVTSLNQAGSATDSFMSSSAVDVSGIAGQQGPMSTAISYVSQLRPTDISVIDQDSANSATSFLKTSIGPRGFNNGTDPGGAQNQSERKVVDKLSSLGAPVPYMPVIAGGVNGIVTGSNSEWLAASVSAASSPVGPYVALEPNFEDPQVRDARFVYSDGAQSLTPKGGTPFWRADSFFLIRQLASDNVNSKPSSYNFTVGSDTGLTPLAPYQGVLQPYARGIRDHSTYNGMKAEKLSEVFGKYGLLTGSSSSNPVLKVDTSIGTNRATTRELITFGQMSHFGYTNAYDSVMDTVWDSTADHQYASGSMNPVFKDQLFDSSNAPRMLPLFGQAIKYAGYPDFSWATIPANPERVKQRITVGDSSNTSIFSDLPDSFQGQYSCFPVPDPDPSVSSTWRLAIDDWSGASANGRNVYGHARYHSSGAQRYDTFTLPSSTPSHMSTVPHTAYTLDTYASYPTVESPDWIEGHLTITSSAPPQLTGFPVGSGFSVISTPAFFTEIKPDLSSGGYADFDRWGTFYEPGSQRGTKSWMDSGLSRDLNVELTRGHKHQGVNIDFTDNWCGFTLMTASTMWRPLESPGRESASLPLQANVYKRQYLNFKRDFKIEAPVRAVSPSGVESGGFWNFTAPNAKTRELAEESLPEGRSIRKSGDSIYYDFYAGGTCRPENPHITNEGAVALEAKRYHKTYSMNLVQGGFTPGPNQGGVNSSRMFVGQAPALEPKDSVTQSPIPFGGTPFYRAGDPQFNGTILDDEFDRMIAATRLSGSAPTNPIKDGLYILQPGDKLALGVQPSLPGWNPGSGSPNNRWAKKYGVWDYDGDNSVGARLADVDSDGFVIDDPMMNLQDPYEPSHGLTMLAGPSRVILYGSFLRDNKHYSNSSTQKIRSNAVHEALHYDNPVLDQFNIEPGSAHKSSYLTQLVTGSILDVGDPRDGKVRGVAAKLSDKNLVFSGSFQRFTRASEDSQIFYDTLPISPFDIARADGGYFLDGNASDRARYVIVNLHMNNPALVASSSEALKEGFFNLVYGHALSNLWADSFPFDRYSQYTRLVTPSLKFGAELPNAVCRMNLPEVSPGGPQTTVSIPSGDKVYYNDNFPTYSPSPQSNVSGSHTRMSPQFYDNEILPWFQTTFPGRTNLFPPQGVNATGVDIITITNSAKVRQATFLEGKTTPNADWKPYPPENTENNQRMFWTSILGYGRQNGKQLDLNRVKSLDIVHNDVSGLVQLRGGAVYDHPAGFKYGYMNSFRLSPSVVHRADRYGQFRDMLEQRLYGKTYSTGDEFTNRGQTSPAVTCIFVDADGAPISDSRQTQCLNLSTAMTSSKPYIEGEVMREIIFSSESVTIE